MGFISLETRSGGNDVRNEDGRIDLDLLTDERECAQAGPSATRVMERMTVNVRSLAHRLPSLAPKM